jgi:hypothetical protein
MRKKKGKGAPFQKKVFKINFWQIKCLFSLSKGSKDECALYGMEYHGDIPQKCCGKDNVGGNAEKTCEEAHIYAFADADSVYRNGQHGYRDGDGHENRNCRDIYRNAYRLEIGVMDGDGRNL